MVDKKVFSKDNQAISKKVKVHIYITLENDIFILNQIIC
ncbi:hypothetical protein J2S21_004514 [Peribacillus cavernae]|nr:hypothetical protein [Peribacillus cavernae]